MPNIDVVRPGGLQRDRAGLAVRARARPRRPTALALSRQGLPVWDPAGVPRRRDRARRLRAARRSERRARPDPDRHRLRGPRRARRGASCSRPRACTVRLVSMPCLDRFAEQDQAYRDSVLPPVGARACRRRGGEPARLAPLGRRRRRRRRRWRASARPRRRRRCTSTSASRPRTCRARQQCAQRASCLRTGRAQMSVSDRSTSGSPR